ncbi:MULTISPECIES: homocysteine S-methyltransferase [Halomonadaceae]|uniref:S-methylmethionine:homocysteine methyltransferase n=1 Tax=Onishia taeanensis TaxID=284577 RepID=A0A328Y311_9GAMM|nr:MULTISPECIES: homocysteine S-methyltransferase [Halomonas]RAR62847.1 homocysteine S-methyltransferase [Halomonas taeanensis]
MPTQDPIAASLARARYLIVDGALATELQTRGHDLSGDLWSARLLRDDPAAIRDVHAAYFSAGADIAITASYQATVEGFQRLGLDAASAEALIQRSVALAQEARDAHWATHASDDIPYPLVAASVGPYGAYLADGSEYRGYYGIDRAALADFHRPRLATLLAARPDLLAIETLPSLDEALALADLVAERPGTQAWITFSARDAQHISDGTPIAECARALRDRPGICAIGINCTALEHIESLIGEIRAECTLPIIVYPNSGEHYDGVTKRWHAGCASDEAPVDLAAGAPRWLAAGATAIGGCCRTGPDDVRALAEQRRGTHQ